MPTSAGAVSLVGMANVQDEIARLLRFQYDHPEVEFSVLGPGICIKAAIPGRIPIVRIRLEDLLNDLDEAYRRDVSRG